ncbi:sugar transferase [Fulvivirga lutimaris]|uniref:sugar transferase n=1 Tax=Fulvivirga lutimaris TaxID=1819566 RepID=UPI0012BD6964|nr:sugar transferase [Fulvivirga lutimaris]MTI38854.1 sugar transferase [Fulvivirga lutimaris]
MYRLLIKPFFDFLTSLVLLLFLSPIMLVVIILLAIFQKRQIFFTQQRPGKNEKLFKVIKFKTMTDERDASGNLLPDKDRLTWIGNIVRKTSLDELPQLINVLKGDMSFIGPRPWLVEYLPLYNSEQRRRHEVKPGISGWAQVNGRNAISWDQRFEYDLYYVDNQSFWLDLKIIFLTIKKVFVAEGISAEGSATMEKFKGNR